MIDIFKTRLGLGQRILCNSIPDPIEGGDPGFDGGGGTTGSGGNPIPPSGGGAGDVANDTSLITSSGGLVGFETALLIPLFDPEFGAFTVGTFDFKDFNTEEDCEYQYRQEILMPGRQITVSKIRFIYRDLGICTLCIEVRTAQDQDLKKSKRTITIGSTSATGKLVTAFVDLVITGERPQVIITRKANNGPLSITELAMITDVEIAEQL